MAQPKIGGEQGYLRIATEEAWSPPELLDAYLRILDEPDCDKGFKNFMGFYLKSPSDKATGVFSKLTNLGENRIADMDARGIDRQILGLTSPGVQVLPKDEAVAMAALSNDMLGEACNKYPDRFTGMAACAPQDPEGAAKELERAVNYLDMRALIINSHTLGEYLSDQKFWPILEAAEALDVPIYLHPQTAPEPTVNEFAEAGLEGAVWGFGVETAFHALRIIRSGAFDRFPKLQFILGHLSENLVFQMFRLDYWHDVAVRSNRFDFVKQLERGSISDYLKNNFHITNSGVAWEPAIKFTIDQMGEDRVLYAMDYPYQCPVEEVELLDAMDMPLASKKKFFQTNAEKLFKL